MSSNQIAIGADVLSKEGDSIGQVKHLVVDANDNRVTGLVADKGIFDEGRIVSVDYVTSITEKGVTLSLSTNDAKGLPGFVKHEYFQFRDAATIGGLSGGTVDLPSSGNVWYHYGSGSGGLPSTGATMFYPQPVVGGVVAQQVSPLEESDVVLDHGTDVVSADGHKIGKVDEILYGDEMKVTGFVVKAGFLFHHDITVPLDWVAGMAHDHVRLNVPKDVAETAKR
jgi:uncharacterized protein YrrD